MSQTESAKDEKHVHVILPFDEWAGIKKMLIDRGEQLSPFIRRLMLAELNGHRVGGDDRRAS